LFKNPQKYLKDDDETDPTNFVLKRKAREGYDYKLVPKSVWEPLQKRFGGREIVREKEKD